MEMQTRFRSTFMSFMSSARSRNLRQSVARLKRRLSGAAPVVHYFHRADDPGSHLTVCYLGALADAYDIPFMQHLVSQAAPEFLGESTMFDAWQFKDATTIAAWYGATLPSEMPSTDATRLANANNHLASALAAGQFANDAPGISQAFWDGADITDMADCGASSLIEEGNSLRQELGHYMSASFHFDGEWYRGVDRIELLERRLIKEGFARKPGAGYVVPRATGKPATDANASDVTLEYFPSLRSPYTAVGHARVMDMIERSGVKAIIRPVMPMMMRGIPAPFPKQVYITTDAGREADYYEVPYGRIVDPFGEPVKLAFSIYTRLEDESTKAAFVTEFLSAAWAEGLDITGKEGLAVILNRLSLDISLIENPDPDWMQVLDTNLAAMQEAGLWGVPSFRVSGGNADTPFACWGQDRIWRVETEIAERVGR